MIKDILKRSAAGLLSALTLLTTVPLSGAVDGGIMPLAEEDNEASSIEINVGEVYNIADKGVQKAWFQQNGAPRNVWPMFTKASDGTEIRAYCADHSKGNPGTSGMPYTVTSRVSDMHVYGVAARSDARMTLSEFISFAGSPISAENFSADMYFSASQAAIWCALGDAQIAANSSYGVSYGSSTSLGYRAAGKTLSASSTSEALTLFAAIKMLEYGNEFYGVWGPGGKNHAPWVGATLNYTPGNTEYTPAAQKTGTIDVGGSIVSGGTFAEKEIDGQQYMVLPMAAASATFVRGNQIFVRADNVPSGAFLMDSQGNKSTDDSGSQRLTLANVQKNNDLYKNGNDMAYGETFLFCIPKATAEQMDASQEHIQTQIFISMNVDRYNVYAASTTSSGVQPVIMVEPAVQKMSVNVGFNPETFIEYTLLKILKTDESGAPLAGCTFQISYQQDGTPKTQEQTTDGNGEANVYQTYFKSKGKAPMPLLTDWRNEVMRQVDPEAREIALAAELITEGSLNVFAHPGNVDMDNRLVVLDLYEMGEQLRPTALVVTLEAIQNRVMENRRKGKYTWVFLDEVYLYFKYHYSGEFLYRAWKRFRKYAGIMTAATQNVEECLKSETARLMLANSEFLLLFNQAATDRAELSKLLHISDTQMGYITNAEPGHGLLRIGGALVPFANTIPKDSELYRLMSTTPGE